MRIIKSDDGRPGDDLSYGTGVFIVLSAILGSPASLPMAVRLCYAPLPRELHVAAAAALTFSLVIPLIWLAGLIGGPLWFIVERKNSARRMHLAVSLSVLLVSWLAIPVMIGAGAIVPDLLGRRHALPRMARNAQPLITAIERYERESGSCPNTINDLIPEYLSKMPYTGAVGYPDFHYRKASEGDAFHKYEIQVRTSCGFSNFDRYFFWPEGGYPVESREIELVGDWAYHHE